MIVGTISLNINTPDFNYGAMLHSWAFQQYLLKQDYIDATEIIDYIMPVLEGYSRKWPIISSIVHFHAKTAIQYILTYKPYREKLTKFEAFICKNLIVSKDKYTQRKLNAARLPYDTVICESDVIWAPGFSGAHFDKSFFLALDSMNGMNRIAYAPSMANGDLSLEQGQELCELLKYVDHISCRESYERNILKKYTEKSVTHVLDPVMLLSEDEYASITAERLIKDKYILLYLPVDDNESLRKYAKAYATKYNLIILEISTKLLSKDTEGYKCLATAGIEDFLAGIKYAECVFTNSFHAICFAVIFHRDFYAFSRTYAGKVKDICKVLGLKERYFPDDNFVEMEPIEYAVVDTRLMELKESSEMWLNQAMNSSR